MFAIWNRTTLILLSLSLLLIGCNNGTYSNPTSLPTTPTEWRAMTVTDAGATYTFSDIGAYVNFPAGAIPEGEVHVYNIRLNPASIPMLPTGPVYVRLGTFELAGSFDAFLVPVQVQWEIVDYRTPGISTEAFWLNDDNVWEWSQVAVVLTDGLHVSSSVPHTGVYGSFERVPMHVEITASRTQGPIPLSVGLNAVVTGGTPPYTIFWDFGDNTDPKGGNSVSHLYEAPGTFTATCTVSDSLEAWETDWIIITCYYMPGPHTLP